MRAAIRTAVAVGLALCLPDAMAARDNAPSPAQVQAGEAIYGRCRACHSLGHDRTGPRHCGLFGRRAGSIKGFGYSEAMKRSMLVWNEKTLDRFLANPDKTVPGTTMTIAGMRNRKERTELIAYLRRANESQECNRATQ